MTEPTAINQYLKKFFTNQTMEKLSVAAIYESFNRKQSEIEKNKTWLRNKMTYLKKYDLIEPDYEQTGNIKKLSGIKLTEKGKLVLKSEKGPSASVSTSMPMPLVSNQSIAVTPNNIIDNNRLTDIISDLSRRNKDRNIEVDINIKGGEIVRIRLLQD